jgi:simple sugar transport system substrate-binding protein
VSLGYVQVRSGDPARVAERIDTAVAARPDGLVIAIEDIDIPAASIDAAAALGVPIVSVGPAGGTAPHVLARVERDETAAGVAAGRMLGTLGVTNALCLTVDVGDPADSRCSGAANGLAEHGGILDVLTAIDPAGDPSGIRGAVAARLRADPTIDGVLMTDPIGTSQTVGAITGAGRLGDLTLATLGIDDEALDALEAGAMAFAVDQQPFLEGYLPVMALGLYLRDGLLPGSGALLVGSVMVTQQEASRVRALHEEGIR